MKVTPTAAKGILLEAKRNLGLDDTQITGASVYRLAQALDAWGLALAASALEVLKLENEERNHLRLKPLRRLSDRHIGEALDGED